MVVRAHEFLRHNHIEHLAVGEALDARGQHLSVKIDALGLLREHDGNVEMTRHYACDAYPGSLNGKNLRDGNIGEQSLEFGTHRIQQTHIYLMVEKAIDLEYTAGLHYAVAADTLFKKLHAKTFPKTNPTRQRDGCRTSAEQFPHGEAIRLSCSLRHEDEAGDSIISPHCNTIARFEINRSDQRTTIQGDFMPHVRKPKLIEQRLQMHAALLAADPRSLRGRWREALGIPEARLHVDLGCGKGLWLTRTAQHHPDELFVGIDNERMCVSFAVEGLSLAGIGNARAALDDASSLQKLFAPGEIDVLHINFPTPFPRKKEAAKRVANAERLMEYRTALAEDGHIQLKTDSQPFFDYTIEQMDLAGFEIIRMTRDLHGEAMEGAEREGFDSFDFTLSAYEEKLTGKGARVMALHAAPGAAPECFEPSEPVGLVHYLPEDLETLEYAPHGMEDTVNNLRNRKRNAEAKAAAKDAEAK